MAQQILLLEAVLLAKDRLEEAAAAVNGIIPEEVIPMLQVQVLLVKALAEVLLLIVQQMMVQVEAGEQQTGDLTHDISELESLEREAQPRTFNQIKQKIQSRGTKIKPDDYVGFSKLPYQVYR